MRVAQFVHRYPPAVGGAEGYAGRLAAFLAAAGDPVTVWTSTAVDLEAMWRRGREVREGFDEPWGSPPRTAPPVGVNPTARQGMVAVRRFRPLRFPGRRYLLKAASFVPIPSLQALTLPCNPVCPGMWRAAGRDPGPVDAVHALAFPYAFPAACGLRLARRHGVPFVLTPFLHLGDPTDPADGTRRQYTGRPLRWLLRQADAVFAQTPSEAAAVAGLGVPADRVVLQGLGVDPADCTGGDRAAARRAWGAGPDDVVVGHLANNSAEKGTVDLLQAAAGLGVRVVLAGPEMPNFRRFWAGYGPKGRVARVGVLSEAAKRDFFAGLDVFALPSRTDSFGLVLLEAWANAKPVVCYRAGGPADLVRDGADGFQPRCGDVAGWAAALGRLAADAGLRRALGEAGQTRVGREFRWADKLELVRDTLWRVGRGSARPTSLAARGPRRRASSTRPT